MTEDRPDPEVRLVRLDDQSVTRWKRYRVAVANQPVGFLAEEREWLAHRYGPRRWCAVHNPSGSAWRACWRSEPSSTRQTALEALVEHLATCPAEG